ncbi:Type II secretion system protein E [Pirellula sp. SH-Sr6A]|uniref:GspE/PulE family protein n=1 Tax=Pirellula sp. SH-Sr6A TaxID=1632865 RepID=UPI00078E5C0E|nr:ATPase, T2SS/T4P/T4SS family [Pirellula sp. SH-Sr6A]AMV30558.1 Type II secretion system protein E [Pirellula sp. SH-Sr6A]
MITEAGELLLRRGLITQEQLTQSRNNMNGGGILESIISSGFAKEEDALRAVADEFGLDFIDLREANPDLSLLQTFPQKLIYRHGLFPIKREGGQLFVATHNPLDLYPIDEAAAATGLQVVPLVAEKSEIAKLVKKHLGVGSETIEGLMAAKAEDDEIELLEKIEADGSELGEQAQEASVVRLVNELLVEAVDSRSSDVHIESQASGLVVRYRIDGILHTQPVPPEINRFQAAIISRLKIMARLNIAEKRLPQDGRIKLRVHGREVDVRVSVIPMIHGESLVMRILDKGSMKFDLRNLGMGDATYKLFSELIRLPHGIILVTGPTGSGKTTTLYSSLLEIKSPEVKIITTEDPVEYQLEGISQIQVHPKIGLTFAASLRSILRHDPDVVLVGEIRDAETAENAIQASLTGHTVFSTLHTNDAAGAFTRIVDMGIEPFLVASTVEGIMAQRLVRRLCPSCKEPYAPKPEDMPRDFPWHKLEGRPLYRPVGCRTCRNLGYAGRFGIYELLATTEKVRQLAHDRKSSFEIKQAAIEAGMLTLRDDAFRKAMEGATSIDEVLRATKGDHLG